MGTHELVVVTILTVIISVGPSSIPGRWFMFYT